MTYLALVFVFGVWVLQQLPELPSLYWVLLLIPCLFLAFLFHRISRPYSLTCRNGCLLVVAFAAGFFWASGYAHHRLADELPSDWQGKNIQIIGVVASMPQQLERSDRFEFDVERVLTQDADSNQAVYVPAHISLAQYSTEFGSNQAAENPTSQFHAGERWELTVRLKQSHGTANPHGFDFEMWALEHNIRATGYVRKDDGNQKLSNFVMRPTYIVEAIRENIRSRMQGVLVNQPYEGVLRALAIGDESGISQNDWQVFLKTGTNHLMSISYPLKHKYLMATISKPAGILNFLLGLIFSLFLILNYNRIKNFVYTVMTRILCCLSIADLVKSQGINNTPASAA